MYWGFLDIYLGCCIADLVGLLNIHFLFFKIYFWLLVNLIWAFRGICSGIFEIYFGLLGNVCVFCRFIFGILGKCIWAMRFFAKLFHQSFYIIVLFIVRVSLRFS